MEDCDLMSIQFWQQGWLKKGAKGLVRGTRNGTGTNMYVEKFKSAYIFVVLYYGIDSTVVSTP